MLIREQLGQDKPSTMHAAIQKLVVISIGGQEQIKDTFPI